MQQRSRREEYSEATRNALLAAAQANFGEFGYAATSVETVAREARVTRGALYHHFADKRALFEAVVQQVQGDCARLVRDAALRESDPSRRLDVGIAAFLAASQTRDYHRIVLEDAISVLGWRRWREIDAQYMFGSLAAALAALADAGLLQRGSLDLLAHLLMGAFAEAALTVVSSDAPAETADDARKLLLGFIASQRPA